MIGQFLTYSIDSIALWEIFPEMVYFPIRKNCRTDEYVVHYEYVTERDRGGGSFFHQNRTWMCLPDLEKSGLSLYQFFLPNFPTHQYTIFERKAPNLDQIGCFLQ